MNVLILDDEPINLKLFAHILKGVEGISISAFDDPVQALAWCRDNKPDLALVDYMMPGMDGMAFMAHLRMLYVDAPVATIMLTADAERSVRHRALRLGANDFLTKPADPVELRSRVRNILAQREAEMALRARAHSLSDAVIEAACTIAASEADAVHRLARLAKCRDPETGMHQLRMAHYARVLAAGLGLDDDEQEVIFAAAPMHDIGKVGIPDQILLKPGPLDGAEMACMRSHAQLGADLLAGSRSPVLQAAAAIALHHHEKYDGSGYPGGLAGPAISLYGRIVAVADVFDALTTARPYKDAWDSERAFAMLEAGAGSHFDPSCVRAFLAQRPAVLAIHARYGNPAAA